MAQLVPQRPLRQFNQFKLIHMLQQPTNIIILQQLPGQVLALMQQQRWACKWPGKVSMKRIVFYQSNLFSLTFCLTLIYVNSLLNLIIIKLFRCCTNWTSGCCRTTTSPSITSKSSRTRSSANCCCYDWSLFYAALSSSVAMA